MGVSGKVSLIACPNPFSIQTVVSKVNWHCETCDGSAGGGRSLANDTFPGISVGHESWARVGSWSESRTGVKELDRLSALRSRERSPLGGILYVSKPPIPGVQDAWTDHLAGPDLWFHTWTGAIREVNPRFCAHSDSVSLTHCRNDFKK
jgi:hypothetical protein